MEINSLAKSIVDQAIGDKPIKKKQPATTKLLPRSQDTAYDTCHGSRITHHVWTIEELVGLLS
jgi:hypothetical protein